MQIWTSLNPFAVDVKSAPTNFVSKLIKCSRAAVLDQDEQRWAPSHNHEQVCGLNHYKLSNYKRHCCWYFPFGLLAGAVCPQWHDHEAVNNCWPFNVLIRFWKSLGIPTDFHMNTKATADHGKLQLKNVSSTSMQGVPYIIHLDVNEKSCSVFMTGKGTKEKGMHSRLPWYGCVLCIVAILKLDKIYSTRCYFMFKEIMLGGEVRPVYCF